MTSYCSFLGFHNPYNPFMVSSLTMSHPPFLNSSTTSLTSEKKKRTVQFDKVCMYICFTTLITSYFQSCRVILIPTRKEYLNHGLNLWWTPNDYNEFKRDGMNDVAYTENYQVVNSQDNMSGIRMLIVTEEQNLVKSKLLDEFSKFIHILEHQYGFPSKFTFNHCSYHNIEKILHLKESFYNIVIYDYRHFILNQMSLNTTTFSSIQKSISSCSNQYVTNICLHNYIEDISNSIQNQYHLIMKINQSISVQNWCNIANTFKVNLISSQLSCLVHTRLSSFFDSSQPMLLRSNEVINVKEKKITRDSVYDKKHK